MEYHIIAFIVGFILDMLFGDPYWLPHPIQAIGNLISWLEGRLLGKKTEEIAEDRRDTEKELKNGKWLVMLVLLITVIGTALLLACAYGIHEYAGVVVEAVMTYQILAAKCLKAESMKVYDCLKKQDLEASRKAVSMIVGRDTSVLDETGVAKATIETVAENTSDGVIAPMLYTALGGPVLGFFYKAVNTMDSMVGYKNQRYLHFGRVAAKLDDVMNYIPARISAYLMIGVSFVMGKDFSGKQAYRIYKRDNRKHASPNSAQTESVCAGALGIQLAGNASYFGKIVEKPYIGDETRKVVYEDIRRINRLMYATACFCEGVCIFLLYLGWTLCR
ncbi:MAG: cobalamin biosynthesis protein CobD [Lachnospiraceae bacterium]|nr:cobalamin biosynthesis protein CobD [Lachnospiraceae bacterium]